MNKKHLHISLFLSVALLLLSCSTSKNTALSRHYRAMLTKYNIAFNGNTSYKEGMDNILKNSTNDYSRILHLFPVSNHSAIQSASSNMDRAIEKSRKAIKLHSIKKKPMRDYRKMKDPKYRAWYSQNEFNPELKKVWLQLGRAEFHKGEFLGSVGTFSYIMRHYAAEPEVVQAAQLWMARAYRELGWLYEAEDVLKKIKPETVFPFNKGLYHAAWADLLIKQNETKQAIPHLQLAIEHEKDRKQRIRFHFVMAQLLQRIGDKEGANVHYARVIRANPPYEMDFNARINRAQLSAENPRIAEKQLKRMAKNRNNKEYLDQIYTALGNLAIAQKDSVKAMQYYDLAIRKSTRNGVDKGVPLIIMGDWYYTARKYVKAHPYYDEASKIYTNEHDDFERIRMRSEALGELVKEYELFHLQDSLQRLAAVSETERLAAIRRVIDRLKKEEKAEAESKQIAKQRAADNDFSMPMQPIGSSSADWYFYNSMTVNNGKREFRRRWGNRKLEDNWRRANKSAALFADGTSMASVDTIPQKPDSVASAPSLTVARANTAQTNDKYSVDYYLAQIPFTEAQKRKSDEQIATSLYNMAFVYKDKIEDYPLAYQTFNDFQRRFPADKRVLETLYQRFLLASKEHDKAAAGQFRNEILANFADSKYAEQLADRNFIENQQRMFQEQDRIYNLTYTAFTQSDYPTVFTNTTEIKRKYPMATLMPQFEFLNTLSIGKTEGAEKFEQSLNTLVEKYPQSSIGGIAKDILALLKQGNIAQRGNSFGSLLTKRGQENLSEEQKEAQHFSTIKFAPHRMMLITNASDSAINKLQYNLAIFNFSRFMIKDFGLELVKADDTRRALCVLNLASYNEGIWYQNTLATDKELQEQFQTLNVEQVLVSEENFGKLRTTFTLEDYLVFQAETLSKDVPTALLAADEKPVRKSTTVEIIDGTKLVEARPAKTDEEEPAKLQSEVPGSTKKPEEKSIESNNKSIDKGSGSRTPEATNTTPTKASDSEQQSKRYKDLYLYNAGVSHHVAFYIPRGGHFDFNTVKAALDKYNATNYAAMNLKVTLEEFGKESILLISVFSDANVAKSYFLRMLREPTIVKATSGMNKRNLIITRENLNTMLENNALDIYFEFMREYYLK